MPTESPERPKKSTTGREVPASLLLLRTVAAAGSRWFPEASSYLAERLFLRTRRFAQPAWERRHLETAEPFTLDSRSRELAAWSWGRGPTVLLVHGWEGRGGQLGSFVPALTEHGYRVLTWDGPGHGASPGNRSSLPEMAAAVHAAAAAAGPVHAVIAHSAGATATTIAMRDGLDPGRLVYLAPGVDLDSYAELFSRLLGFSDDVRRRLKRRVEQRVGESWDDLQPLAIARRLGERGRLAPLTLIHDEDDPDAPWSASRRLADAWPGAELISTRGLGHRRLLRDPQVIATAVERITRPRPPAADAGAGTAASPITAPGAARADRPAPELVSCRSR